MTVVSSLLNALSSLCGTASIPGSVELLLLTTAGLLPARRCPSRRSQDLFRLAVVVPAHNEELSIVRCVQSLLAAERTGIELEVVVIADNCTDRTAALAREAGAQVIERSNFYERGKGYALHFAFTRLLDGHRQAFAVVDADTEVSAHFLVDLAALFQAGVEAVQCRYCIRSIDSSLRSRLTSLASGAFNILRPRGRHRLGLSAGIYGNGFALSAETLQEIPYSASSVVEDAEYHLELVRAGRRVMFADRTAVYASLPAAENEAANTQRARWEGGRLRLLVTEAPGLLGEVLRGRLRLLEPLLDLLLLPLAFHVVLLIVASLSSQAIVRDFAYLSLLIVAFHLLASIRVAGGGLRAVAAMAAAPFYIGWKLLLLPRLLRGARSDAAWIRTERVQVHK